MVGLIHCAKPWSVPAMVGWGCHSWLGSGTTLRQKLQLIDHKSPNIVRTQTHPSCCGDPSKKNHHSCWNLLGNFARCPIWWNFSILQRGPLGFHSKSTAIWWNLSISRNFRTFQRKSKDIHHPQLVRSTSLGYFWRPASKPSECLQNTTDSKCSPSPEGLDDRTFRDLDQSILFCPLTMCYWKEERWCFQMINSLTQSPLRKRLFPGKWL